MTEPNIPDPTDTGPSNTGPGDTGADAIGTGDPTAGRVTALLARVADGVEVRPDLDAITDTDAPMLVRLDERPARTRRRLALAGVAAAALVMVAGLAVLAQRDRSEPVTAAAPPGPADIYPVVDHIPPGLDAEPNASELGLVPEAGSTVLTVEAVLGRRLPDGSVTDLITLQTSWSDLTVEEPFDGELREIDGRRANVLTETVSTPGREFVNVALDSEPLIFATGGPDLVEILESIGTEGLLSGLDERQNPTLTVADPPGDIDVLQAPTEVGDWGNRTLSISEGDGQPGVYVRASGPLPLSDLAHAVDPARPVDIHGEQGWVGATEEGSMVAWTAANGTNLTATVEGFDEAEALAVARGVRLVDEATWYDTYPVDRQGPPTDAGPDAPTTSLPEGHTRLPDGSIVLPDGSVTPPEDTPVSDEAPPTTAATDPAPATVADGQLLAEHPLLGQPMPEVAGLNTYDSYTRAWTAVTFVASWCAPCQTSVAELFAFAQPHLAVADLRTIAVLVDDDDQAGRDLLGEAVTVAGDPVHATAADLAAVSVGPDLPTTYLIDPEGTVVSVFVGPVAAQALEAELAAQQDAAGHPELTWVQDGYCSYPNRGTGRPSC